MFSNRKLTLLLALSICAAGTSCRKTQAYAHLDSRALLEIARTYKPSLPAGQVLAAARVPEPLRVSPDKLQTEMEYESPIKQYFSQ
jgi:hypothetical protein